MSDIVYVCPGCGQQIQPADQVVQTIKIRRVHTMGRWSEEQLVGEWFHERCWGTGVPPFRETDRGPLAEVLQRS